jgi:hypothetical protein
MDMKIWIFCVSSLHTPKPYPHIGVFSWFCEALVKPYSDQLGVGPDMSIQFDTYTHTDTPNLIELLSIKEQGI